MHSPPFPSLHVLLVFTPSLESKPCPAAGFTSDPFHGEREQKEKVRRECCVSEPSITDLHRHEPLVTGELHHVTGELHHVTGDQDASIVAMSEKVNRSWRRNSVCRPETSTLGVVYAAAQLSRPVVPRLRGETDEYMIFGRIGATGIFIRILFGLRVSGVVYMGYCVMRYCWWHAVLQIGGDLGVSRPWRRNSVCRPETSTLGVVYAAAQLSRPVVPRLRGPWTSGLVSHTSLSDFPVTHPSRFPISGGDGCHNLVSERVSVPAPTRDGD
ncbi:hypothetical protein F2Q68_00016886 [Brassica cretica]|uniref:t-SNARE coiled-coil homology domain-containing protein n=1 Tax=Brassica cretica TaxID=69181 RepID=A0A8S9HI00_BRACR|nr:hypothetical protein F2Q68_00016886 [Brassica cretica]